MGLLDFFRFRRKNDGWDPSTSSDGESECRRELRDAWNALYGKEFDKAESLAQRFVDSSDSELARESKMVVALARFRKGDYPAAVPLFQEVALPSDRASDWVSVFTSATLAGDIALAERAFKRALQCQEDSGFSQKPSVPRMRQFFACALRDRGEFQLAFEQLEELRLIYERYKVTDDTYLYILEVPLFSHTMTVAVDVFRGLGDSFDADQWIDSFASKLDEEGRKFLQVIKESL